jgi:hypothetical protein
MLTQDTTLTADEINFFGSLSGTNLALVLQPTDNREIRLGGTADDTTIENLDLTTQELGQLQNAGLSSITIGRSDGGNVAIAPDGVTFNDPVILQSGNAIDVSGSSITGQGNASVSLSAPTILSPNITTANQNISLNGNVTLANTSILDTGTSGGGNINITGTVNGTTPGTQDFILRAGTGTINFQSALGNTTEIGNLLIENASNTTLNGNVTTGTGSSISVNSPLMLTQDTTLTADEINFFGSLSGTNLALVLQPTNNRGIQLGGTADDTTIENLDLTTQELGQLQNAGLSSITIGRSDGGNVAIAPDGVTFYDPVILQSQNAIALNGSITGQDNASITLQGLTVLNGNNNAITTSGSNITFNGDLNGTSDNGQNLTLSASSGNITFNSTVGNARALMNLQVNSTGTTAFSNSVNAASLITDVGGTTLLNGDVTTTGDQNYADTLLLQSAITTLTSARRQKIEGRGQKVKKPTVQAF